MKKWHKYTIALILTAGLFVSAGYGSYLASRQKIGHLQETQDKIATDVLSSETQFDLLQEAGCENSDNLTLGTEISSLADKINYSEKNLSNTDEILALKKQYSILEIKDFLLAKRIATKCNKQVNSILYFYGTKESCPECTKQGYVLDALRQRYPSVRIYAFDYNLDLSSIRAMKKIYKVGANLPGLVINGTALNGYQDLDHLTTLLPREITNPAPVVGDKK